MIRLIPPVIVGGDLVGCSVGEFPCIGGEIETLYVPPD